MQVRTEVERVKFINHKGKDIIFLDFSEASSAGVIEVVEEIKKVMVAQPEHSVLLLVNAKNARFNLQVVDALKDFARLCMPYVKKGAAVGIEGMQTLIYDTVTKFCKGNFPSVDDIQKVREKIQRFDKIEKAKDWLVED